MANLLVEMGNTALKAAYAQGLTLGKTFRYQGERAVEYVCSLTERERPEMLVISSVKPIADKDRQLLNNCSSKVLILDPLNTALLSFYKLPHYLSYDRVCSLVAVRELFKGRRCTIFDFGTTLSVDFIDENGNYLGGNVSPGCRTRFKSLNRYAKALPLVNTPKSIAPVGNGVVSSIEAGVISGMVFEVEGYLNLNPDNVVVFTGGDADYFAKQTKSPTFIVHNLALMGLSSIANNYEGTE